MFECLNEIFSILPSSSEPHTVLLVCELALSAFYTLEIVLSQAIDLGPDYMGALTHW